jgi:tetratricopeptide (TPR) repeat protein
MTHAKSSSEALETVAGPAALDEQLGSPVAGADAAGAVSLALAAAAGPAVTEGLSDFLAEQQQLARKQCDVADRQARFLEHRIERAGLEREHIEAQNLHLRMQHIHDRLRLDCFRFRGDVHDHRGEWAEAQRAYADGVARAPSLPHAYFSWGTALLRHQQYSAAIDKLTAAHARSPRWADPLEAWAQALAKLGQPRQAVKKYAEAVGYSPNWGALHLHWGEALDRLGDRAMAIEQFRKAEGLALSDADRLTVARYLTSRANEG